MSILELGNHLFNILNTSQQSLFKLGELTQLSFNAFEVIASSVTDDSDIKLKYPLGLSIDGQTITGETVYSKKDYIEHYSYLAFSDLPLNGVYRLVTTMETMFVELMTEILLQYPKKIGAKRTIPFSSIFECSTLESVHMTAISAFINELIYTSPRDFADAVSGVFSFSLLKIPAFHGFIELKATRDVYIHNRGIANVVYKNKAESHARVSVGSNLPMTNNYFLQSYEHCIKLTEEMMAEFNKVWSSPRYDDYLKRLASQKEVIQESSEGAPADEPST